MTEKKVQVEPVPRGTIQEDADGKWVVLATTFYNGKPRLQRIRYGSLAHQISFPEHFET